MTPELINRMAAHETVREFLRFALVGTFATAVHYALLISLKEGAGVEAVLATSIGYLVGALISYTLNRLYTFAFRPAFGAGLFKYLLVIAIGAAINAGIFAALTHLGLHYFLAQVIATILVMIWNFVGSRALVFRA